MLKNTKFHLDFEQNRSIPTFDSMGDRDFQDEQLDSYLEKVTSSEPALLEKLRLHTIEQFKNHHMLSGYVQGRYLSLISKILRPKKILEIGTFTGYATLCLSEGLAEDGQILTIDKDESLQEFFKPYFAQSGMIDKIRTVTADAEQFLENTAEIFDLVFLDANKRKYINYFELLVPKLVPGGIILADNTLWKGKVLESNVKTDKITNALHDFNRHVAADERVEVVLLPLRDGISLIRKK